MIARFDSYFEDAEAHEFGELARVAARNGEVVPCSVIIKVAQQGGLEREVVSLLEPHLDSLVWEELVAVLHVLGGVYGDLTSVGPGVLRVVDTPAHRSLLNCLKRYGIVSSFSSSGGKLKVNRKHK